MENQKKLIESPLGGEAAPLMIPMVTSASVRRWRRVPENERDQGQAH